MYEPRHEDLTRLQTLLPNVLMGPPVSCGQASRRRCCVRLRTSRCTCLA